MSGPYFAPSQTGCRWRLWQGKVGKVDEGDEWGGGLGVLCFQLLNGIKRVFFLLFSDIGTGWGMCCIMLVWYKRSYFVNGVWKVLA